eukprot:gene5614-11332_t
MQFFFSSGPIININFSSTKPRRKVNVPGSESQEEICIFEGDETISGVAVIVLSPGKKLDHLGIKIEMVGQIELYYDRGNNMKFTSIVRELEAPGALNQTQSYPFEFNTEKPFESYGGINVRLRYLVRVTITRSYNMNVVKEQDFTVQNISTTSSNQTNAEESIAPPTALPLIEENTDGTVVQTPSQTLPVPVPMSGPMKMEVGIEDCLHIEFEYDKPRYHLKDMIRGKIHFLLVRIKIKHMELAIIRRESGGSGANAYNESESITKFELMDGAPVKGEVVPIRLHLSPLELLTPTYKSVNNVYSVKYYLNLVLVDEEDRRYFKQQEVILWRKDFG